MIETAPNPQTKLFAGRPINLSALARAIGCSPSHLSRIFKGQSYPSLPLAVDLAHNLSMSTDEFASHLSTLNKDESVVA